jgi:Zn-dependent oligopeptidase
MAGAKFGQIWSRMLAADAFSAIEEAEADDVLSCPKVQAVTMRFRETVLATGSRRHMTETFRKFRGRDPSHEALLFSLGLKQVNHPHLRGS